MSTITHILLLPSLVLVVARLAGMLLVAPVFGEAAVPVRLRLLMAAVLAMALVGRVAPPTAWPTSNVAFVLAVAGEMLIGVAIGYAARLVFVGVELGAFHASQQMGLSLGEVLGAGGEESSDVLRSFFHLLAVVIFLAIGGHRMLIGELVHSFQSVPLMSFIGMGSLLAGLAALLTASFVLALKVAAPVLLAMLLAGLALAFIQRTTPQFNLLSTGMPVRIVLGLCVIAAVLAMGAMVDLLDSANNILTTQVRAILEGRL